MKPPRLGFIDWMKSLGILLIVFGHVSAAGDRLLPPIYPKQLGVAFFLFVTGFTLAQETRPTKAVLFNRLFEVYVVGLGCALLVSLVNFLDSGRLALSNYLPFLLGANVVFDHFPANPSTWFVGTYLHLLLIWAVVLRGRPVRPWMLVVSAVAEVGIRSVLTESAGRFVGYMALSNWMTVFLLGLHEGQQTATRPAAGPLRQAVWLLTFLVACPVLIGPNVRAYAFPFMELRLSPPLFSSVIRSMLVTFVYLFATWRVYQVAQGLPALAFSRFLARNTLFVFVVQMPVFYAVRAAVTGWTNDPVLRLTAFMIACFVGPVLLSELVHRTILGRPGRDRLSRYLLRLPKPQPLRHELEPVAMDGAELAPVQPG